MISSLLLLFSVYFLNKEYLRRKVVGVSVGPCPGRECTEGIAGILAAALYQEFLVEDLGTEEFESASPVHDVPVDHNLVEEVPSSPV